MILQQERVSELIAEVLPLLRLHYEELTLNKEVVKLAPKWDDYAVLEDMGRFVVFTARADDGTLAAYNAFFLNTHMHYSGLTVAVNDVFYVRDDHRRGPLAFRLIKHTEKALRALVDSRSPLKVAYHCKRGNNFSAILARLNYQDEEDVLGKII